MLKWPVFCSGAVMSLTGAAWVWQGLGIVQVERGWSGVISGAVLLGAGAIILALAAVHGARPLTPTIDDLGAGDASAGLGAEAFDVGIHLG